MSTYSKYEVRQEVKSIYKKWLIVIFETSEERLARLSYDNLILEHPEEYFELAEVKTEENCLAFTSKHGEQQSDFKRENADFEAQRKRVRERIAETRRRLS